MLKLHERFLLLVELNIECYYIYTKNSIITFMEQILLLLLLLLFCLL